MTRCNPISSGICVWNFTRNS